MVTLDVYCRNFLVRVFRPPLVPTYNITQRYAHKYNIIDFEWPTDPQLLTLIFIAFIQVQWKFTEWTNCYTTAKNPGFPSVDFFVFFVTNPTQYNYYTPYIGVFRFECMCLGFSVPQQFADKLASVYLLCASFVK